MQIGSHISCGVCGHDNVAGSRFCGGCGARIDNDCTNCGQENEVGGSFCNSCGEWLNRDAKEASPGSASSGPTSGTVVCPRCLHGNESGAEFCYHCGLPLEGDAARAAPRPIRAFELGAPSGFGRRTIAFIIDNVVLTFLGLAIYVLFGESAAEYFSFYFSWSLESDRSFVFADFVNLVVSLLYAPVMISVWGTTIGKRSMNLYVVKSDGGRCGFWQALGRTLASVLSLLLLGVGYLMVAFREDKRALHDLMAQYGGHQTLGDERLGHHPNFLSAGGFLALVFRQTRSHPSILAPVDGAHLLIRDALDCPCFGCLSDAGPRSRV